MIRIQLLVHGSVWRDEQYQQPEFDPGLNFESRAKLRALYLQVIIADFKFRFENAIAAIKSTWNIALLIESKGNDWEIMDND